MYVADDSIFNFHMKKGIWGVGDVIVGRKPSFYDSCFRIVVFSLKYDRMRVRRFVEVNMTIIQNRAEEIGKGSGKAI